MRPGIVQDRIALLIQQVATQDRAAFAELYLTTSDTLFGLLLRMLRNRANAEDGLQEVFARVWARAQSFVQTRGSGMTWLMTIARNYAIDQKRQDRRVDIDDLDVDHLVDPRPGAEHYLSVRSVARQIVICLEMLDNVHADCVKSAYLDGKSYADLATRHDVPINTIRTWLRRSLQKLRDCVTDGA
jgi:RNA polymerase sigma-70 factor, ECF subfamily